MKVMWLNDSLTLRGETKEEKVALAVVFRGLQPHDCPDLNGTEETAEELTTPST